MDIPQGIKDAVNKGIKSPCCTSGRAVIIITERPLYYNGLVWPDTKVICDNCYKSLTIRYKEDPFEIVEVRRDE